MDRQRWAQIDRLFHEALLLEAPARTDYLHRAAADRPLADEVNRLLGIHDRAGDFLETSDIASLATPEADGHTQPSFKSGDLIDRFRLVRQLGTGGMGEVWLAQRADRQFDQNVALKIIRAGRSTPEGMRRFVEERQTLARLEHPSITRLIDGGTTPDGRPYFVMEWVDGVPILEHCEKRGLTRSDKLALFRSVCDAVQYAHQNLVVHRDLKPANVMVAPDGRPRLLDFGIAQLLEPSGNECAGEIGGRVLTPDYASPEQLRGEPCTTGSDVYSLGVLLHELVLGSVPLRRGGGITAFAGGDPVIDAIKFAPSVSKRLGDLAPVLEKALDPAARRRYATAKELGEDIGRCLDGYPVHARPPTLANRAGKFARRNVLLCSVAGLTAFALIAAGTVAVESWKLSRHERDTAVAATEFLEAVLGSVSPFSLGRDPTVEDLLQKTSERASSQLADRPEVELRVRMTLARAHVAMWKWEQVLRESRRALLLSDHLFGPRSAETATCLSLLGRAQTWLVNASAVPTQERALAIRRRLYDGDHPVVAESLINLGFATWRTAGDAHSEQAEAFYREGLAIFRKGGSTDTDDYARALFSFANFLQPRRAEAGNVLALLREALAVHEKLNQPPDRYSTSAHFMYGNMLIMSGQAGEGVKRLRQFVDQVPNAITEGVPLHIAYASIGFVEGLRGDREAALTAFRQAIVRECRLRAADAGSFGPWSTLGDEVLAAKDAASLALAVARIVETLALSSDRRNAPLLEGLAAAITLSAGPSEKPQAKVLLRRIQSIMEERFPEASSGCACCFVLSAYLEPPHEARLEAEADLDRAYQVLLADRGDFALCTQLALKELIHLSEQRGAIEKARRFRSLLTDLETPGNK